MPIVQSAAAAFLLAAALPNEILPFGSPVFGIFCLVPYFRALGSARSYREAALCGAVFGFLAHALSSYWLFFFKDFALWTIGSTSLAYAGLQALVAVFLRRFSLPADRSGLRPSASPDALRPFLLAAAWTVWEWNKSIGFLGYPWGLAAYALNDVPALVQVVDFLGVWGLSFLVAAANAAVAEVLRFSPPLPFRLRSFASSPAGRAAAFAAVAFIATALYGAFRLANPAPVVDEVPMVLVQHNEDAWETGGEIQTLERCQRLTREGVAALGEDPALVAWSETVLMRPYDDYLSFYRKNPASEPFLGFLSSLGSPLLVGTAQVLDWEELAATNSAYLIRPDSTVAYRYAKSHPVPFAEAIPFWEYEWMRNFMRNVVGLQSGWVMGTESVVMEIPTPSGRPLRFGVPICFEDAFADVCARFVRGGADILVNLTNDSWSNTKSAETQHFVAARFRAVENRRTLVRSTNGGMTAVVDAQGGIVASLPLFEEAALAVRVPVQIAEAPTVYFLLGDWFPALLALALFAYLAASVLSGKKAAL